MDIASTINLFRYCSKENHQANIVQPELNFTIDVCNVSQDTLNNFLYVKKFENVFTFIIL